MGNRMLRVAFWTVLAAAYASFGWVVGLLLLLVIMVRSIRFALRLARALAPHTRCPRGHRVPQHGRYLCSACGAETMGSAWWCHWCGTRYGHMPCQACSEIVGNPLFRG